MSKNLVIVESPAKARTIGRILPSSYIIKATMGHVRDLPEKEIGVDPDNGFTPKYITAKGKQKIINEIKSAAQNADTLYLATDPDREGEAISWHIVKAAKLDRIPAKRVVFHEITKEAVDEAFRNPRELNTDLVDAQQARRILDRLVGYKISPILWKKVMKGLSAGRVQSVAVQMVVAREREIQNFMPREYWSLDADLAKDKQGFRAELTGDTQGNKISINNEAEVQGLCSLLEKARYEVSRVQRKQTPRQPVAPFITSTLQQEAWRKLRFSAKRTMVAAQSLYEGIAINGGNEPVGLITYMRTDSTHVANPAIEETRNFISSKYGESYLPAKPRTFAKKVKGAQEAHEAIRPTSMYNEPKTIKPHLTNDQYRLYDLIWKRMVASQMAAAIYDTTKVDILAITNEGTYKFKATSSPLIFNGFLTLYSEGRDDEEENENKTRLPALNEKDHLDLIGLISDQHFTQPPQRYTEATLIKDMEENGIGRPSTYAPIISTIQDRDYVVKEKGRFKPNEMGFIVTDLLAEYFPEIVNTKFTARMEEKLDEISSGKAKWVPLLTDFYQTFAKELEQANVNMPKNRPPAEPTEQICEKCASPMVIKRGRFGKFLACSNFPTCRNSKPLQTTINVNCPKCSGKLVEKRTKKKKVFYGCENYPKCDFAVWEKPLNAPCPQCQELLVPVKKSSMVKCTQCDYKGSVEEFEETGNGS